MSEADFIKAATPKDINLCLRGLFIFKLIEIQKIDVKLDEDALQIVNVVIALKKSAYQQFMKLLLELIDYLPENLYEFCVVSSREKLAYLKHKPTALVLAFLDYVYVFELMTGAKGDKKPKWKSIYEVADTLTTSQTHSQ